MFEIVKQINRLQFLREARLAEFLQSRHLYLPYSFSRETKVCGDFRESAVGVHIDTEPHADYLCFTCSQCFHTIMTGEGVVLFPVGGRYYVTLLLGQDRGKTHAPHSRHMQTTPHDSISLCTDPYPISMCISRQV